jgi:putative PIN family toxin of toxin-antitoxin system
MTHFVFDTNVIVSALLFNDSGPGRAFFRALNYGTILIARPLVKELSEVLCRSKFDRYISPEERDKFLEALVTESNLIETTESVHVCRDPEDNQILELAVNGNAAFIVTGDIDLLVLNPFRGVQIVTPAEFLKREPDHERRRRDDEHDE